MVIPLELRLLSLAVLLALLSWVVRLIRHRRLSVQDSLPWLISTLLAIIAAAFPPLLGAVSRVIGVQVPANAVFGAGLVYLAVNVLALTITASANSSRVRRLAQECALLRAEIDRLRATAASSDGTKG